INVLKATPSISWADPADITYGTALSSTQLNASAAWTVNGSAVSVAGSFTYTPLSGAVLNAGNGQTLATSFVPTDSTDYTTAAKSVSLNVLKATPAISWSTPADITSATALISTRLNRATSWAVGGVTGPVVGTFSYNPPAGTVLGAGSVQFLSTTFTPFDTTDYTPATDMVAINVLKATPSISWADPADITYGTALSSTQLSASAAWTVNGSTVRVTGSFTYTPP